MERSSGEMSARRAAENDARFRQANENIRDVATRADMRLIPFICECAELSCTQILRLTADEYESVRADARRFLVAPGHEGNGTHWAHVVEERDGHVVVEKTGEAIDVAEELNPRGGRDG